jgi:hypothetical protein
MSVELDASRQQRGQRAAEVIARLVTGVALVGNSSVW